MAVLRDRGMTFSVYIVSCGWGAAFPSTGERRNTAWLRQRLSIAIEPLDDWLADLKLSDSMVA